MDSQHTKAILRSRAILLRVPLVLRAIRLRAIRPRVELLLRAIPPSKAIPLRAALLAGTRLKATRLRAVRPRATLLSRAATLLSRAAILPSRAAILPSKAVTHLSRAAIPRRAIRLQEPPAGSRRKLEGTLPLALPRSLQWLVALAALPWKSSSRVFCSASTSGAAPIILSS